MQKIQQCDLITFYFKHQLHNATHETFRSLECLLNKIGEIYRNFIKKGINFLKSLAWHKTGIVLGTMLLEPTSALKAACFYPLGWQKSYNIYGTNPKNIAHAKKFKRPILFLHGSLHNQSASCSFAKTCLNNNKVGEIYTVNLDNKSFKKSHDIIREKIDQIIEQYKKEYNIDTQIDIVAHSRGGISAQGAWWEISNEKLWLWQPDARIHKVVILGNPVNKDRVEILENENQLHKLYEITGEHDCLVDRKPENIVNQSRVKTGHLGLLFNQEVHDIIIKELND